MIIETPRLLIREFSPNDAAFIYTLMNTSGWLRFIGDRQIVSTDAAKTHIENNLMPSYKTNNFGFWCVIEKDSGLPIGMNGLIKREVLENVDHGFAFLPEFSGLGFAYESSNAILKYAHEKLAIDKLVAITDQENIRSQALLKKLDFKKIGLRTVKAEWGESLFYEKELVTKNTVIARSAATWESQE